MKIRFWLTVSEEEYAAAKKLSETEDITTEQAAHWIFQFGIKYLNGHGGKQATLPRTGLHGDARKEE